MMSVTERLDNYMRIHKCKMSDIARLSGIPYTTLKGFYDKGDGNIKLSTLKKLKNLLDCTLDELVGVKDSDNTFSLDEKLLLSKFSLLNEQNKKALLFSIDVLISSQNMVSESADAEKEKMTNKSA